MQISKYEESVRILVDTKKLDNESQFQDLGILFNRDSHCTRKMRETIVISKVAFNMKMTLHSKTELQVVEMLRVGVAL